MVLVPGSIDGMDRLDDGDGMDGVLNDGDGVDGVDGVLHDGARVGVVVVAGSEEGGRGSGHSHQGAQHNLIGKRESSTLVRTLFLDRYLKSSEGSRFQF